VTVVAAQTPTSGKDEVAEKVERVRRGSYMRLVGMKPQPIAFQPSANCGANFRKSFLVVVEDNHIVHISEIRPDIQSLLNEVIEIVQVKLAKNWLVRLPMGSPVVVPMT